MQGVEKILGLFKFKTERGWLFYDVHKHLPPCKDLKNLNVKITVDLSWRNPADTILTKWSWSTSP